MATLTAQGVTDALQSVCGSPAAQGVEGAPQFRKELNLALPRLYNMGMWRDLLFEHVVSTSGGTFTIPAHAESIVAALLDSTGDSVDYSYPQKIRSQFHDYNIVGRNDRDGKNTLASFGIVDDGYSPTVEEPADGKTYSLKLQPISPATTLPASGKVHVTFSDGTGTSSPTADHTVSMGGQFTCNGQASLTTNTTTITSISEIRMSDTELTAPVKLTWEETGSSATLVAADSIQQANRITRYRRYRIDNRNNTTMSIRLLLKRKFEQLLSPADIVHMSSLNAIKHAMLGSIAEENADLERANYHWSVCRGVLDEQLDAHRGAAKPAVRFDPAGSGGTVLNIM